MREIKFRAWDPVVMTFLSWERLLANQTMMCRFLDPDLIFLQYTGLHDKNGKEIYEGDILLVQLQDYGCPKVELFQILWDDSSVRYKLIDKNGDSWGFDNSSSMEVISNIYENPELVKNE
jgi:uncharacterized phage protein (TIGR01671 family)